MGGLDDSLSGVIQLFGYPLISRAYVLPFTVLLPNLIKSGASLPLLIPSSLFCPELANLLRGPSLFCRFYYPRRY